MCSADSRVLCLPCLKAGIFCFNTTATDLVMSSFLFLTFCVYVFRCLGLHFSVSILSKLSFGGFYLRRTNLHRGLTLAQQGWSGASVVSLPYPALKTAHRVAQGRVWFFLPRTSLPLPLKGEGRGITFLGLVGFALLVQNWGTLAQQGRSGASLVSFPYPAPKIAHRATQGRVWFSPSFSPTFSRWQHGQLPLQMVIHRFLDG